MERKRDEFIPVGDLALDLPGVQVPARRGRSGQARHFTQLNQVTQLSADYKTLAELLAQA